MLKLSQADIDISDRDGIKDKRDGRDRNHLGGLQTPVGVDWQSQRRETRKGRIKGTLDRVRRLHKCTCSNSDGTAAEHEMRTEIHLRSATITESLRDGRMNQQLLLMGIPV